MFVGAWRLLTELKRHHHPIMEVERPRTNQANVITKVYSEEGPRLWMGTNLIPRIEIKLLHVGWFLDTYPGKPRVWMG